MEPDWVGWVGWGRSDSRNIPRSQSVGSMDSPMFAVMQNSAG